MTKAINYPFKSQWCFLFVLLAIVNDIYLRANTEVKGLIKYISVNQKFIWSTYFPSVIVLFLSYPVTNSKRFHSMEEKPSTLKV